MPRDSTSNNHPVATALGSDTLRVMTANTALPVRVSWPYLIAALVSLAGLCDAIYLTVQHITGESLRCTIISGCSEVLSSPYAQVGPFPLAAIGAAAYFAVFSLAILAAFGYRLAVPSLKILLGLMFLTTLWLLYLQAFVIRHFCQYCLLSAAVTTALVLIVFLSGVFEKKRNGPIQPTN